jgi:hypothetical protein
VSVVHGLPSLQSSPTPALHAPPWHLSPDVQAEPSSHGSVLLAFTHPEAGLHESFVQTLPSSQSSSAPGMQEPLPHVSPSVQALPSVHGCVLFVFVQPVAGLQASFVQTLPSSQSTAAPDSQAPPEH